MIQTIWFFIQISLIVTALVWISFRTGEVSIDLMDYTLKTELGIFLLGLVIIFFVVSLFLWAVKTIITAPKIIAEQHKETQKHRGYKALTKGLVAVAVGDSKLANKYSKKAKSLIGENEGLPVLLEAQAARLRGDEEVAHNCFVSLSENKDTAFLGLRGLLRSSLIQGDYVQALDYIEKAREDHPKQDWILKTAYELEIKNKLWFQAMQTAKKAVSLGAMDADKTKSDTIAMWIELSDRLLEDGGDTEVLNYLKKAYKLDKSYVPTVTRLCEYYERKNNNAKVVSLVSKGWAQNPHPNLAKIWKKLAPVLDDKNKKKYLKWFERLLVIEPNNDLALLLVAEAAVRVENWERALEYIKQAEALHPSSELYRLKSIVQKNSSVDNDADISASVRHMMERVADTQPEKCWICSETGRIYERWVALAEPHNAFNTIIWDFPQAFRLSEDYLSQSNLSVANEFGF